MTNLIKTVFHDLKRQPVLGVLSVVGTAIAIYLIMIVVMLQDVKTAPILLLLVTPLAFAADRALVHLEIVKTYTFTMQHHLLVAVGTTLLMAVMIAVGIWVPAYRAGRISPALALRSE